VCGARLNHRSSALGVAAQAENLHLASDALAVVATVFLVFRGKAGTGHVCAFLGMSHHYSFAGPLGALLFRARDSTARTDAKIVAQIRMRARGKSHGKLLPVFPADCPNGINALEPGAWRR
jgi:hypothetical protein